MLEEDVFLLFGFFMLSGRVIKYQERGLQLAWKFSDFLSTEEKMSSITGFGDDGAKILRRWSIIASDVLSDPKFEEEMFPILLVDWKWTPVGELKSLKLAWKFSDFLSTEGEMSLITGFGDDGIRDEDVYPVAINGEYVDNCNLILNTIKTTLK